VGEAVTQPYASMEERLWLNSAEPDDGRRCRVWLCYCNGKGYGRISVRKPNKATPASLWVHRVAYETFIGPIPKGMEVDHTCDRESCIAPWHLELVTGTENLARRDWRRRVEA
jgi:hypothetical protein